MLKSLIWGSSAPGWDEDEQPQLSQHSQQSQDFSLSQLDPRAASAPITNNHQQLQPPSVPNADNAKSHHIERSFSSLRAKYTLRRGGPRAGPLSVNDPELAVPHDGFNPLLSEGFFALPSPLAPEGVGKEWRVKFRDAVVHVHLLLRAMLAGQDYAGAARSLAVLHRLHGAFDPDVYRYTVALLRLSGDHTKTMMYFRKMMGVMLRTPGKSNASRGTVIVHDYLAYLSDTQEYKEALNTFQNIPFTKGRTGRGMDPSLQAHGAVLHLLAALLEYQQLSGPSPSSSPSSNQAIAGAEASSPSLIPPPLRDSRVPDLQDPLALIEPLRACWRDCTVGGGIAEPDAVDADGLRLRALGHLQEAAKLAEQAAKNSPENASAAGYRAAIEAARRGPALALRQLESFVERNPGSVKGRNLYARLLEKNLADATDRRVEERETAAAATAAGAAPGQPAPETFGKSAAMAAATATPGTHLIEVAHARALRGWLETDPLEPRSALGLAALHARRSSSGASVGVAGEAFIVNALVLQVETHGHARVFPSPPPQPCQRQHHTPGGKGGSSSLPYNTTRAAVALWRALADILGPLRVRDAPTPVLSCSRRQGGNGGGGDPAAAYAGANARLAGPPRPGTIWERLYGRDPPWAPTDFEQRFDNRFWGSGGVGFGVDTAMGDIGVNAGGGGFVPEAPVPHPLLRGVDRELWEDTLLDSGADPLLLGVGTGGIRVEPRGGKEAEDAGGMWCSDDDDCVVFNANFHTGDNSDDRGASTDGDEDEEREQEKEREKEEQVALFLLQERARLASQNDGGCVYYSPPPAAEEEIRSWSGGVWQIENETNQQQHRRQQEQTTATKADNLATQQALPSTHTSENNATGGGGDDVLPPTKQEHDAIGDQDVTRTGEDGNDGGGGSENAGISGDVSASKQEARGEVDVPWLAVTDMGKQEQEKGKPTHVWGKGRAIRPGGSLKTAGGAATVRGRKRRREGRRGKVRGQGQGGTEEDNVMGVMNDDKLDTGDAGVRAEDERGKTSKSAKRRKIFAGFDEEEDPGTQDTDVVYSKTVVRGVDWANAVAHDDGGKGAGGELDDSTDLREDEVPPGPPVGADAEASRLAETISVRLPSEEAVWVLASKCCVAAHLFGPQHPYCLEAIGQLCRNDVREVAKQARQTLRKRGFRLQVSLARLAAKRVRATAAAEGYTGVGRGLPGPRPGSWRGRVQPRDSYVPEFMSRIPAPS